MVLPRIETAAAADESQGCSEKISTRIGKDDTDSRLYVSAGYTYYDSVENGMWSHEAKKCGLGLE